MRNFTPRFMGSTRSMLKAVHVPAADPPVHGSYAPQDLNEFLTLKLPVEICSACLGRRVLQDIQADRAGAQFARSRSAITLRASSDAAFRRSSALPISPSRAPASSQASAALATRQAPMPRAEPLSVCASVATPLGAAVRIRAISRVDCRSN